MKKNAIEDSSLAPFKVSLIVLSLSLLAACAGAPSKAPPTLTKHESLNKERHSQANKAKQHYPDLVCKNASRYAGRQVGDGHCVSLIKQCTQAPFTSEWRPGQKVLNAELPVGTVIATFHGQHYPSKHGHHAAIYIEQDSSGIWVWDQWQGKSVHRRLIRIRHDGADPGNTAQAYRVVKLKPKK